MFNINLTNINIDPNEWILVTGKISFNLGKENTEYRDDYIGQTLLVMLRKVMSCKDDIEQEVVLHDSPDRLIFRKLGNTVGIKYIEFQSSTQRKEYKAKEQWSCFVEKTRKACEKILTAANLNSHVSPQSREMNELIKLLVS